jgi:DNA repair exonuclease SbcCD nuclease subunit
MLPSGINSRLQDSLNILEQIYQICKDENVDCVLCGGDIFHIRAIINISTFNLVYEAIAKIKTVVDDFVLLVGNHDQANKIGTIHAAYTFQAIVTVVDTPGWVHIDDKMSVLCIPFTEEKDKITTAIQENVNEPTKGSKVLLGHFGVSGARPGSDFVLVTSDLPTLPELMYTHFSQVFLGHYHEPQELLPNVRYIGATHQHNWGDINQKRGVLLWDTDDRKYKQPTLYPLKAPQFIKIKPGEHLRSKGDFVRVVFDKLLDTDQWETMKEKYLKQGARWVEEWTDIKKSELTSGNVVYSPTLDVSTMINQYVDEECPSNLDPKVLKDLGNEFLNNCT